jgi:hypothetical protein
MATGLADRLLVHNIVASTPGKRWRWATSTVNLPNRRRPAARSRHSPYKQHQARQQQVMCETTWCMMHRGLSNQAIRVPATRCFILIFHLAMRFHWLPIANELHRQRSAVWRVPGGALLVQRAYKQASCPSLRLLSLLNGCVRVYHIKSVKE